MYRRRPVVSPDDIASMLPVQLGSGVNLMGYYMFHGGRNPIGDSTLEESTLSGGYNDTTAVNYDFQAPLGPDGQQRAVLTKLRPFHYFMADFGARLAPMTVRRPAVTPANATDLKTARVSLRSNGDSAFLFVNNHVRQYPMPAQKDVRFAVKLPGGTVEFPRKGIDVANGAYFVWPVNFDMDGTRLRYATAQPVTRLDGGAAGITYVFAASAGVPVELDRIKPGSGTAVTVKRAGGRPVNVLVLTPEQAQQLTVGDFAGQRRLVLSAQQAWFDHGGLQLRSPGNHRFRFGVYPALAKTPADVRAAGKDGVFQSYERS